MNHIITHTKIDQRLCGRPLAVEEGFSRVELLTTGEMAADDSGLVHGGFVFGLADYAAMIAVNHPNVVLGAAEVKFVKPVQVGQTIHAEARLAEKKGKKHRIDVAVHLADQEVFRGEFICFALDTHVLSQ
jgi:acyl-coenzyme A thioesterase PaaI-like protein